jgi:phage protein D
MGAGYSILFDNAPDSELGSPSSIEVHECLGSPVRFRLTYGVDIVEGDLPLLADARLSPGKIISIFSQTAAGLPCLIKGPVTSQQIHLVHGGAGSVLEVSGADTSITMDREDKAALWTGSDSSAIQQIVGTYSLVPDVETTSAMHDETKHVLVQRETDLAFVRRLARRNGCLFWVACDDTGLIETASFKRPALDGEAVNELIINLTDPVANLASLDIAWNVERPTSATALQVDQGSLSDIDGAVAQSPLSPLGAQGFAAIATGTRALHLHAPVDDAGDLQARGEAALIEAEFFVRARGTTTAQALGDVLRSHTVVNLRGAGARHSGKWFCASVRHTLDDVGHRMDFELIRNGWEA